MCGQLGIQPRDEPPERVRMIGLNAELFAQLRPLTVSMIWREELIARRAAAEIW